MMYQIFAHEPEGICLGTVILLPGRGGLATNMLQYYKEFAELEHSRLIALQPYDEWYPAPRSPDDQQEAVWGLKVSVPDLDNFLLELGKDLGIKRSDMALVGFSAGAVIAIQAAALTDQPFAAVVAHAGAILEPESLPPAQNETPILLLHSEDDDCFAWDERYLPMREALFSQGYNVETSENTDGGHAISPYDIAEAAIFLAERFQYPQEWKHTAQHIE